MNRLVIAMLAAGLSLMAADTKNKQSKSNSADTKAIGPEDWKNPRNKAKLEKAKQPKPGDAGDEKSMNKSDGKKGK